MDLSDNMLISIFEHLELSSLYACCHVCKDWARVINGPVFQRSLHARPCHQPRLVFNLFYKNTTLSGRSLWSSPSLWDSREPHKSFAASRSQCPPVRYDCVHGLICVGSTIINPTLGREFDIPLISPSDSEEHRMLGFDPISYRHKLLALRVNKRTGLGDYRVQTLGDDSRNWKIVNSATPELPKTEGICINGMVFYFILSAGTCSLVRFNTAAETIECFPVPEQASHSVEKHLDSPHTLLEYKTKLAFVSPLTTGDGLPDCTFGLWVLNDVENQIWTRLSFTTTNHYRRSLGLGAMSVKRETGEIVLVASGESWKMHLVYIDVDTRRKEVSDRRSTSFITKRIRNQRIP